MSTTEKPGAPESTPTPRTDAEHYTVETMANYGMGDEYDHHVVDVEFARTLEREVARLTRERDEARALLAEHEESRANYIREAIDEVKTRVRAALGDE